MRRGEEASGRFKALLSLAFLAASIFAAIKTFPAYVNNYQLQDHIRQLSTQLAVRSTPATPDEVTNEVVQFAQDHGIPLAPDNVRVTIGHHVNDQPGLHGSGGLERLYSSAALYAVGGKLVVITRGTICASTALESPLVPKSGVVTPGRVAGWKKGVIAGVLLVLVCFTGLFVYYYVRFSRLIDARLSGEIFNNASLVFAAPTPVSVGEAGSAEEVAPHLRRAFYAEGSGGSAVGTYTLAKDQIEITPGPLSYFADPATQEGPATSDLPG